MPVPVCWDCPPAPSGRRTWPGRLRSPDSSTRLPVQNPRVWWFGPGEREWSTGPETRFYQACPNDSSAASLEYQSKKRKTRRELFLKRMDGLVPWQLVEERVPPHYPKEGGGRRPYPLPSCCGFKGAGTARPAHRENHGARPGNGERSMSIGNGTFALPAPEEWTGQPLWRSTQPMQLQAAR